MDWLTYKLMQLEIGIINKILFVENIVWPYLGLVAGLLIGLGWVSRKNRLGKILFKFASLLMIFELGLFFGVPYAAIYLTGADYFLPDSHLRATLLSCLAGIAIVFLLFRYLSPSVERIKHRLIKTSSVERNRRTDIREISRHLPNPQTAYDPCRYFEDNGVFFGLDESRHSVMVPVEKWRKSHVEIVGTTGSGKGVAAGVLLTQAVRAGEAVVVFDPKNDEFLPHVMQQTAQAAKVPYIFLDLCGNIPQWNPLYNKTAREIEELLNAGFSLGEKGTDADFYRLDDRKASRIFSRSLGEMRPSLVNAYRRALTETPDIFEYAKKFASDLEELACLPVTQIHDGIDLAKMIREGAVIYVRGSMRDPAILKLQRILLLSVIQFIEQRDREKARHVCLFLDEFKYLISRPALEALGAIRDKRAHVLIAHQSLGDLRDCPADLDSESVVASVNENCAIKIAYAIKDPDTADWLARMSGQILVDDETRRVKTNIGLSEVKDGERSLRQAERALVDTNMLQGLPERCAVLYGVGLARFFFTSPIRVSKQPGATNPTVFPLRAEGQEQQPEGTVASVSIAAELLDVD